MDSWAPGVKFTPIRLRIPPPPPSLPRSRHFTPNELGLRRAIQAADWKGMDYFLDHGADPNATYYSKTMLHLAIDSKDPGTLVKLLLVYGAKPTSTTLKYAIKRNKLNVVKLLLRGVPATTALVNYARKLGYHAIANVLQKKVPPKRPRLGPCKTPWVEFVSAQEMDTSPALRKETLRVLDEDLKVCPYANAIKMNIVNEDADGYFFAYDASGKCIAGASVYLHEPFPVDGKLMLHLRYLCSSKTCAGSGSFILKEIERYAKLHDMTYVTLIANARAFGFYNKLGYSRGNTMITTRNRFATEQHYIKRVSARK